MAIIQPGIVLRHLRELVTPKSAHSTPDQHLLDRFRNSNEEAAFEALVARHGPLVLSVCRRVLHQEQDAEDVFQATFLVLARKAGSISKRTSVGSWLYRVAYHMALKVRKQSSARQKREAGASRNSECDPLSEITGRELLAVLDEELQELPECERMPLVLCFLEGKTRDEAAREVGCSERTLKRRLERGKERLRTRLARRGLALPAALLSAGLARSVRAAVPGSWTETAVKAGLMIASGETASGVVSVRANALANGALHVMVARKVKATGALLIAVTLLGVGAGLLASAPSAVEPKIPANAVYEKPALKTAKEMTVSGIVLDADGKPFAAAEVAVLAARKISRRGGDLSSGGTEVLGCGKTDAEGRFLLDVPRTSSAQFRSVTAVARGVDHGLGWCDLNPDADKPTAELRLAREQVIRGQLVDLQGQSVVGVSVRVTSIGRHTPGDFKGVHAPVDVKDLPFWPKPAVTDKDGRYELHGIGREVSAFLGINDDRYATQGFEVVTDAKDAAKMFDASLSPAHIIEGTITYADNGKPIAGARLTVYGGKSETDGLLGMDGRADEKGHFHLNPTPGNYFHLSVYAPAGEPYLTVQKRLKWPKAAVKQQVDFELPRGVLVSGKIAEARTGKVLPNSSVTFIPRQTDNPNFRKDVLTGWENTVVSADDGTFDICVLPGPGHLLIHGPTPDYLFSEIGSQKIERGKEGGTRYYAPAILPLDLKPGAKPQTVTATLRHGVTVKGRVIGPDNKPVTHAMMLSRLNVNPSSSEWRGFPVEVRDGRFELHGCDPEKSVLVFFLDPKLKTGASVELSGKQAADEVTVRLLPCGEATTRLLDADSKPLVNHRLWLELVVTPGPSRYDLKRVYEQGELAADAENVANIDRLNHWNGPSTDTDGRITFPALIPGATYRIVEIGDKDEMVKCEFKAESGKTVKLPEMVRKK
jgi:RNA polymerase sigma factor (sigma-70 family)